MKATLRKLGIVIIGWLLVAVGLLLSIPGVPGPGLLIAFIGLYVISTQQAWAHRLMHRIYDRFPRFRRVMEQATQKAHAWFDRTFRRGEDVGQ